MGAQIKSAVDRMNEAMPGNVLTWRRTRKGMATACPSGQVERVLGVFQSAAYDSGLDEDKILVRDLAINFGQPSRVEISVPRRFVADQNFIEYVSDCSDDLSAAFE